MNSLICRTKTALLTGAIAAASVSLACYEGRPEAATTDVQPRYVFLLSLDTVAAQYCSVYGYEKPTTPFLEELGARGAVFERHVVNSNNTLKSHSSIMTGLNPAAHNTYDNGVSNRQKLAEEYDTLAESFRDAGFATAGFTTHPLWLNSKFGFDQGFQHFESSRRKAAANTQAFLKWFDDEKPDRAFVFLHYFDAHSDTSTSGNQPYHARPDLVAKFAGKRPANYTGSIPNSNGKDLYGSKALAVFSDPNRTIPEDQLAYIRGTYDAGLAQLDEAISRLFDELSDREILEDALVIVTSDHGEEFKQHQSMLHMQYFDEVMRVPLIITLPEDYTPSRSRVGDLTRSIDLAPTILELSGLEPLPLAQGRSFASALLTGEPFAYQDTVFEDRILRSQDNESEFKFAWLREHSHFFDLDADPGEQKNLYKSLSQNRRISALKRLQELNSESHAIRDSLNVSRDDNPEMSPEELDQLQGLGYLGDE